MLSENRVPRRYNRLQTSAPRDLPAKTVLRELVITETNLLAHPGQRCEGKKTTCPYLCLVPSGSLPKTSPRRPVCHLGLSCYPVQADGGYRSQGRPQLSLLTEVLEARA